MASFNVAKSISIAATPEKVFDTLTNYHHWKAWSPWVVLEPDVAVSIKDDGKRYSWEGKRTGSGEMKITDASPAHIDMVVTFLKPWKSTSPVWFDLKGNGTSTEVTWGMKGSLPFFMFWMKKMMEGYIGMDYARGLNMLKDYVERETVPSTLHFKGKHPYAGCAYVGIKSKCTIDAISTAMAADFEKLQGWAGENRGNLAGPAFSIYHQWDVVKNEATYTAALQVSQLPAAAAAGMVQGTIPACEVYTVAHKGPYKHVGNAWAAQYLLQRTKAYKHKKGIDPFEVYVTMPGSVPDEEILTEVHFPAK